MSTALSLSLYPDKFQTKWSFATQPWKNCATPHWTSKAKSQDFLGHPGNANSFFNWPREFPHYIVSTYPQEISNPRRVSLSGGRRPHPTIFSKTPPSKLMPSHWVPPPHLKMKSYPPPPPIWKRNPTPRSKREAPFHELIPGKSTINNNLKSS